MELLRKAIRTEIKKYLSEMTTTGNVAGFLTPMAFTGDKKDNSDRINKMAKSIGYRLTHRSKDGIRKGDTLNEHFTELETKINELNENYYAYRNDPSMKPHQKIGTAISEVNRQLKIVERVLKMNRRLQQEYGVTNESLWKRTTNQMVKLEARLIELASRLRDMRG